MHWNGVVVGFARGRTIALPKKGTNTGVEVRSQLLVECKPANDRTRAVIDRRYRRGTCRTERELEKEIKMRKLKIKKKKIKLN